MLLFFFFFGLLLFTAKTFTLANGPLILVFNQSYERAVQLEPTRVFALVESGHILLMLGSFKRVTFIHCKNVLMCFLIH